MARLLPLLAPLVLLVTIHRVMGALYRGRDVAWIQVPYLFPTFMLLLVTVSVGGLIVFIARLATLRIEPDYFVTGETDRCPLCGTRLRRPRPGAQSCPVHRGVEALVHEVAVEPDLDGSAARLDDQAVPFPERLLRAVGEVQDPPRVPSVVPHFSPAARGRRFSMSLILMSSRITQKSPALPLIICTSIDCGNIL